MSIHLNKEIDKLKKQILRLAAMVEEDVRKAVQAVNTRDANLAREVIVKDEDIDTYEINLEEECLKILALHQPVANDLRYVISCMKINSDLERVGDLAVNIAKRAIAISKIQEDTVPVDFTKLMDESQGMLKRSLDALIELDPHRARIVCGQDDVVDDLNKKMKSQIIEFIKAKPERTEYFLFLLNVSKNLERIGDYATNIAEDVIYMIEGCIVRHQPNEASER